MKANIAVATTSGKAYYLIVSKLREKGIHFLSLLPTDPVPVETKVVITTEKEKHLVNHEKVLAYREDTDPEALVNGAVQIIHGKEYFDRLVIGVDPGEVLGLAALTDGRVIETRNCLSVEETVEKVKNVIKNVQNSSAIPVTVKIGDGVRACKEELLHALDYALPQNVVLESVGEAGTSRNLNETKHRRELRDIAAAIRIAGRNGYAFQRRKIDEPNR